MKISVYIFIVASLFLGTVLSANSVGLFEGNQYFINQISGGFSIRCYQNGYMMDASASCHDNYLYPSSWSRFYNYTKVNADEVRLVAYHEDGSINEKTSQFDPEAGVSKSDFNLWIYTLLQRPLLEPGNNIIEFFMTKKAVLVQRGSFTIDVFVGESRRCRYRSYYSHNENDCRTPSTICRSYFREENLCRY